MELIDALNETYELRRKNFMFKLTGALYRPFRQEYDACLSMFLPSESITSVSYTHLDVYKRQHQHPGRR